MICLLQASINIVLRRHPKAKEMQKKNIPEVQVVKIHLTASSRNFQPTCYIIISCPASVEHKGGIRVSQVRPRTNAHQRAHLAIPTLNHQYQWWHPVAASGRKGEPGIGHISSLALAL